jgi:hypothetical protein
MEGEPDSHSALAKARELNLMAEIVELAKTFGPWIALTVFFVWQTSVREAQLSKRLDTVQDFLQSTMITCIKENTTSNNRLCELITRSTNKS